MAIQNDDNKVTHKQTDAVDADELMDSDLLIDSDELIDSDLQIDSDDLVDSDLLIDSDDLVDSDLLIDSDDLVDADVLIDLDETIEEAPELNIPEHAIAEEAQHAVELAAKAAEEAEIIALKEAQLALDANAAVEEAMAIAKAAMQAADDAKAAALATAEAEAEAEKEAQAALEAKGKAIAKAKAEEKARIQAEEEARIQAEEEARIQAEEEARIQAEEEARIQAEEEARIKAEEEARIQAEEKARIKAESEKINAAIESEEFLSLNLDEDETPSQGDGLETLSSLEKELGELTDWVEPDLGPDPSISLEPAMDVNETTHLQNPEKSSPEAAQIPEQKKETAPTTDKSKDKPMTENKKPGLNSLMLSATLISIVIAALAIWMSLDASQQTANLAQEPIKLQKQIDQMNEHQDKQTLLLQQQIKNLQQQLKILTSVIANKQSEKWRDAIEKPSLEKKEVIAKPVSESKPAIEKAVEKPVEVNKAPLATHKSVNAKAKAVVKQIKKNTPAKKTSEIINAPVIASEYATDPASVQGWLVYLFSSMSQKSAERETRQFRAKGIDAKYLRTTSKGKVWYHVLVSGFEDARKAAAFKKFMKEYHGIDSYYNKSANKITELTAKKTVPVKKTPFSKKSKQPSANTSAIKTVQTSTAKNAASESHSYRFQAVNSEVWLQVHAPNEDTTAKGKQLKEVLLKAGHHITIKIASESLWITAGNAPALSISVDGKLVAKVGSLGTGKKVLRNYRFSINSSRN